MNWIAILVIVAVVAVVFLMKKSADISEADAQTHLKNGALVIDVRTAGEFNSGHLAVAINLPLDEIGTTLPQRVTNNSQVLLLHCQSGMRSGMAQRQLNKMGYANAFNLGSYQRAAKIVAGQTE